MSGTEVDVDSWDDMDLALKTSKSTIGQDDKSIDHTMVGLKRTVEETMTDMEKEEGGEYEDVRDNMEDNIAAPPPNKQALPDDDNASVQQNDGQLDRTSTVTSNSLGSHNNSLGDTEKPLQTSGEVNEAGKTGDVSSGQE